MLAAASIRPKSPAAPLPLELPIGRAAHARPAPEPTMLLHTAPVQSPVWHWFGPSQVAPVGRLVEQVPSLAQKSLDGQSASLVHPAPQVIAVVLQLSLRHCSALSHGPSPGANPQVLSFASQTPELQTRVPTSGEQTATVVGIDGNGVPLSSFGTQVPRVSAVPVHQLDAAQSLSTWQPRTQRPLGASQMFPV